MFFLWVLDIHKLLWRPHEETFGKFHVWFVSAFGPPGHNATHRTPDHTTHRNTAHSTVNKHTHTIRHCTDATTARLHTHRTRTPRTRTSFFSVVLMMIHDKLLIASGDESGEGASSYNK